jgi:hypothetical protein
MIIPHALAGEQHRGAVLEMPLDPLDARRERVDVDLGLVLLEAHAAQVRRLKLMAPPVAIMVLDGMQSSRCAAPPTRSRSIMVTCAPSLAA